MKVASKKSRIIIGPILLGPFIDPLPHVLQHEIGILVRLPLDQRVVHPIVELQGLVRTGCLLVQELRRRRTRHPVVRAVNGQKRRRYPAKIILYVLAHPSQLPHGPHPGAPRVPPRVRGYDPQLRGVLDRLPNHLLVRHSRPRVGHAEEQAVEEQPHLAGLHVLRHHEQRGREDQPRPRVRIRLEVHEHGGGPAHGLAEQEGRQVPVRLAPADVGEEGEGGGGDLLHVAEVAAEAVGPAVAEEVGGEDGVAPAGEADADLLEEPAGVGAVAVGHVDRAFDFRAIQR
ncbi:hypothetical protein TorRG33x02_147630 [Trema orientale]|uniref:Uncharacterized protein n=1 Tax=Trema orientale TaxID=63057 RepID=A0A2P5EV53_TREOI|nr:hypothetical protein TorRG33x02_147630 [Trema orientale]